jgi:signal transduction histidine kinase
MNQESSTVDQKKKHRFRGWQPTILIYLLAMNFILLCLLFPTLAFYLFRHEKSFQGAHLDRMLSQMRHTIEQRGSSLAHALSLSAGQAIAGFNYSFLNNMVSDVVRDDNEIIYCFVMDINQRVLVHNDPTQIGIVMKDSTSALVADMENKVFIARLTDETKPTGVRFIDLKVRQGSDTINVMEVVTPVYSGAALAGFLRCGFSLEDLQRETQIVQREFVDKINQLRSSFIFISVLFFLVGGVVAIVFTRMLVRSTRVLSDGVEKIAKGDLKHHIQMDGVVCQEFTRLSDSFNTMTDKLRLSYEQLEQYSKNLEQKVVERTKDLRLAQANLLRQAHEAGMAEMAVGILHNIGNAITPAKVSTALLIKKITESRIRNHIREMMEQLNSFISNPAASTSEENEHVKQIVAILPEALLEEYDHFSNEMKRIRDKHEHIESIIHLQMRYARLSSDTENINVNKILLDSLEMLEESIAKNTVAVTTSLDPDLPPIRVEQSKLLQVLINIIKNGVEAMRDTDPEKRILLITTNLDSKSRSILISIKDSGMGFEPETRKKLFSYGYTTKETGSGFGLHSCANFLIAYHGSIEAKSDGSGKGAEFIISLPVMPDDVTGKNISETEENERNHSTTQ